MAGDWFQMRDDLSEDPDVIAMGTFLETTEVHVCGMLGRFWGWVDRQLAKSNAPGVTKVWVDRYVGVTGFADAMVSVGWLTFDNDGLTIPGFDEYFSESAKRRALTAKRVGKHRAKKAQKSNALSVTKTLPQKRREEKKKKEPPIVPQGGRGSFDPLQVELPEQLQTDAFRAVWTEWVHDRADRRKKITRAGATRQLKMLAGIGPDRAIAAIDHTIQMGWTGLREPDGNICPDQATEPIRPADYR